MHLQFLSACASVYGQQGMAFAVPFWPRGGPGGPPPWAPWVPPTARESPPKHHPKEVFKKIIVYYFEVIKETICKSEPN